MESNRWQRIKRIYQQALDVDKSERHAFVLAECGRDTDLAGEVIKLLDVPTRESREFDGIIGSAAESLGGALSSGERLGAYRILRVIGSGGMGHVYLAERADREFEQRVAIKTVNLGFASPSMLERFQSDQRTVIIASHNLELCPFSCLTI